METGGKFIDIESLIKTNKPELYKKLPHFVISLFKKIICEDKINRLLSLYGHLYGTDFIDAVFKDLDVEITCRGLENVVKGRRYVFAANHPLGGIDGLAVISSVCKNFGPSKAVVNDLLMNIVNLRPVFCGVNVYGHNTPEILRSIEELYASDENVCVFPAGLCSRKIGGKVQDLPWKKNFIEKAVKADLPVVPVFVEALNSGFFYNTALLRKKLGIKFNYELVLLPSEVFKFQGKPITLHFGRLVEPGELKEISSPQKRADFLRERTYLAKNG